MRDEWDSFEHLVETPTLAPRSASYSPAIFLNAEARRSSAMPAMREVQHWMMDSGCGHDLISEAEVRAAAYPTDHDGPGTAFRTASGRAESKRHAPIRVGELDQTARASVLPSIPAVLSIGRRCMHEGFTFVWKASQVPYMTRPDGMIVKLEVHDDIPYRSPTVLARRPVHSAGEIITAP